MWAQSLWGFSRLLGVPKLTGQLFVIFPVVAGSTSLTTVKHQIFMHLEGAWVHLKGA